MTQARRFEYALGERVAVAWGICLGSAYATALFLGGQSVSASLADLAAFAVAFFLCSGAVALRAVNRRTLWFFPFVALWLHLLGQWYGIALAGAVGFSSTSDPDPESVWFSLGFESNVVRLLETAILIGLALAISIQMHAPINLTFIE